jgi:hypothetical protein
VLGLISRRFRTKIETCGDRFVGVRCDVVVIRHPKCGLFANMDTKAGPQTPNTLPIMHLGPSLAFLGAQHGDPVQQTSMQTTYRMAILGHRWVLLGASWALLDGNIGPVWGPLGSFVGASLEAYWGLLLIFEIVIFAKFLMFRFPICLCTHF